MDHPSSKTLHTRLCRRPGPVDNPEEIDLDIEEEDAMDEDAVPDDDEPQSAPLDDDLFAPVEISTYSTADAAVAARAAAGVAGDSRSSGGGLHANGDAAAGGRRGLSAALAGLPPPITGVRLQEQPVNPEEIELPED